MLGLEDKKDLESWDGQQNCPQRPTVQEPRGVPRSCLRRLTEPAASLLWKAGRQRLGPPTAAREPRTPEDWGATPASLSLSPQLPFTEPLSGAGLLVTLFNPGRGIITIPGF